MARLPSQAPAYTQPMQPESIRELPTGKQWQYELRWDGYRIVAAKLREDIKLYSRNRKDLIARYPAIVQLRTPPCTGAVLDGELMA